MLTRRTLLRSTAFGIIGVSVVACSTQQQTTAQTVTQEVVTTVDNLANSLQNVLPNLQSALGISTAKAQDVANLVGKIFAAAGSITITTLKNLALSPAEQIQQDFQAVETDLQGITLPATVQEILTAGEVVLPFILTAVGALGTRKALSAAAQKMTLAQAQQVLAAAAVKH